MDLVSVELRNQCRIYVFCVRGQELCLLEMQCEFNQWFKVDERNLRIIFKISWHLTEQMYTITCDEATNTPLCHYR